MTISKVIDSILLELSKAQLKHPHWPEDKIHAAGIIVEEAGEAMKEALDIEYGGGDIERLKTELRHTGATVIRALMNLK
jgi:hypothetical protein